MDLRLDGLDLAVDNGDFAIIPVGCGNAATLVKKDAGSACTVGCGNAATLSKKDAGRAGTVDLNRQLLETALYTRPGEWPFAAAVGVGINNFVLSEERDCTAVLRLVKLNLKLMKLNVKVNAAVKDGVLKCELV